MIPICDGLGRTIAFGGRTLLDEQPKYLNSRENPLFAKSKMLYGFNYSKDAIRSQNSAIIVEGYMDCLSLMQKGITNSVACLGTALSSHQLKILKARTSRAYLVFDGDTAGQRAMLASLKAALLVSQIEINVVVLPQNEDPDSFVRKEGAGAFSELLAQSVNLLDFAITEELKGTTATQVPDLIQTKFIPWLWKLMIR
jgi:DNA primase